MDETRRRSVDNARTQAEALRRRIQQFIEEYGPDGDGLLNISETAWLAAAQNALLGFDNREVQ